jgi:alpha-tubulin suppressor-like RCC1 family protein
MLSTHLRVRLLLAVTCAAAFACGKGSDTATAPVLGTPTQLRFSVQPTNAAAGAAISPAVVVAIADLTGNVVTTASATITIALGADPGGLTLGGTLTMTTTAGIATFTNLTLPAAGTGFTLTASANGLTSATSSTFSIVTGSVAAVEFTQISAGPSSVCGVTNLGAAYCWGANASYQLGNGTNVNALTPTIIPGKLTFSNVSTRDLSTCGVTFTNLLYCWGANTNGEIGNNTTTANAVPQPVSISDTLVFTNVTVGSSFACGLTTTGEAYCWGGGQDGQLGNKLNSVSDSTPVRVSGGLVFTSISAGEEEMCGVAGLGAAFCWGPGPLGTVAATLSNSPLSVDGGLAFSSVSEGSNTACGVTTSGAAYCWGFNSSGQLGNATQSASTTPAAVSGGLSFISVSVGSEFACAIATGGAAWCWGNNASGQLGNGTLVNSSVPVKVAGTQAFVSVTAGSSFACGLTASGSVYCWGANDSGQLGNGTIVASTQPVQVSAP